MSQSFTAVLYSGWGKRWTAFIQTSLHCRIMSVCKATCRQKSIGIYLLMNHGNSLVVILSLSLPLSLEIREKTTTSVHVSTLTDVMSCIIECQLTFPTTTIDACLVLQMDFTLPPTYHQILTLNKIHKII